MEQRRFGHGQAAELDDDDAITVLGMTAHVERRFIKQRQWDGIERAKARGVYQGGNRRLDRSRIQVYRVLQESRS